MKVGISYLSGIISSEEITDFKRLMNDYDIDLKTFDYDGKLQASFDEIKGVISIFLYAPLVSSFIGSIGTNAA